MLSDSLKDGEGLAAPGTASQLPETLGYLAGQAKGYRAHVDTRLEGCDASIAAFLPHGRVAPPPEVLGGGCALQRATSEAAMTRPASSRGKRA